MRNSRSSQAVGDFVRRLFARKLPEEFLDVLNLERAGVQRVLLDEVFHISLRIGRGPEHYTASAAGIGARVLLSEPRKRSAMTRMITAAFALVALFAAFRPGASRAGDARDGPYHAAGEGGRHDAAAGHVRDSRYWRTRHAAAWTICRRPGICRVCSEREGCCARHRRAHAGPAAPVGTSGGSTARLTGRASQGGRIRSRVNNARQRAVSDSPAGGSLAGSL